MPAPLPDRALVGAARKLAAARGTSLSSMFSLFLHSLLAGAGTKLRNGPLTRNSWRRAGSGSRAPLPGCPEFQNSPADSLAIEDYPIRLLPCAADDALEIPDEDGAVATAGRQHSGVRRELHGGTGIEVPLAQE